MPKTIVLKDCQISELVLGNKNVIYQNPISTIPDESHNTSYEDAEIIEHQDQTQANGTEGYCELTDGTMEQHLRLFKEAMLKAQDIVYKSEHTKLVANTYDWVAAERLGKDIGLLKNYDELADILNGDNFREVPKKTQNLTPYRSIIADNTRFPNWQCYKPNEDGKFRKFKQFADAIYSLYKLNCEKNHIKPFGNM